MIWFATVGVLFWNSFDGVGIQNVSLDCSSGLNYGSSWHRACANKARANIIMEVMSFYNKYQLTCLYMHQNYHIFTEYYVAKI